MEALGKVTGSMPGGGGRFIVFGPYMGGEEDSKKANEGYFFKKMLFIALIQRE